MKAVIIGLDDKHSEDMIKSFVLGYNESRAIYNPNNLDAIDDAACFLIEIYDTYISLLFAFNHNIPLAIKSTTGASSVYYQFLNDTNFSDFYPNVIFIYASGQKCNW